jgi:subtilisin family serine protease
VTVLGQSRVGYSVRVRAGDGAAWEALLAKVPTPVEQSANVRIRVPPIPAKPPEAEVPKGGYLPFGLDGVFLSGGAVDRRDWGRGVAVAVLDTGASTELAAGSDLVRVDLLDGEPGGEHGTAVASLIAGRGPRVVGVAPAASLISVRVASEEGGGDAFTLAEGIVEAADRGAKVINVCLASRGDCFIVRDAVAYAAGKGAVIVAAVGNDGVSGVSYPAAYDGVIAVSGVDRLGRHLAFANEGAAVDLAAPGIGVAAAGSDQTVVSFSGTSAAAPFVSGAAAALWSRYPRLSAEEVTAVLLTSARDVGPPGGDEQYGAGVLDIRRAMDWSRGGLHDAMVGWPYITPLERTAIATEDRQDVLLSVQNRGTEALGRLSLEVEVDGVPSVIPFHNVDVGQTVTHRLSLALAPGNRARTVSLTCRAVLDGVSDANPADNERRVVLQIGQKASEGM